MNFRVRGHRVEFLRPVEDPETGRVRRERVGAAELATGRLNRVAEAKLTPAERLEAEAWLRRRAAVAEKGLEVALYQLPETLESMAGLIGDERRAIPPDLLEDIRLSLGNLSRAVRARRDG